jgi:hypothetical protein
VQRAAADQAFGRGIAQLAARSAFSTHGVKRRYKAGDWIRVPLGGAHDAVGIIASACRSRLFGYFFAIEADRAPTHEQLRSLKAEDAQALLFGGAPIEQARWTVIARSLAFEQASWPFPLFAARGAFGKSWMQIRYDPQTMQVVERQPIDAGRAQTLPDARFAGAREAEALLRARFSGAPAAHAYGVRELRSPIAQEDLDALQAGRVQFSTPLHETDLRRLAAFMQAHPYVDLRVHGFRNGFDARALTSFDALQSLALDVRSLQHPQVLRGLSALQALRMGPMQTDLAFLDALQALECLDLHGTRAALEPVLRIPRLRALTLVQTQPLNFTRLRSAAYLEELALAHGTYDLACLSALPKLRALDLRSVSTGTLEQLQVLGNVRRLVLHGLTHVTDLRPLANLPRLRELRITRMPHLNVQHFAPLQACAGLREFVVDVGSRRKEREIYRLLKRE